MHTDYPVTHSPSNAATPSTPATPRPANHAANVIPLGAAKSRVASEFLISSVLQLISRHGTLTDSEAVAHSAATIEQHLKTLADLPDMEPILRATCLQLSEQWGMLLEQQKPKPSAFSSVFPSSFSSSSSFITRLVSGSRQNRAMNGMK